MWAAWRRAVPFLLAGVLLLNLTSAIMNGGRARWLMVALLALMLALELWWRGRAQR